MMRLTSRAQTRRTDGFTLIECLIALSIASITLGVAAVSLMTCLKAESRADERRHAVTKSATIHTALVLGTDITNALRQAGEGWTASLALRELDKVHGDVAWETWLIQPPESSALPITLVLQKAAEAP